MYIDRIAPPELASQAQSWLILVICGFGQAIGSGVAGALYASEIAPHQVAITLAPSIHPGLAQARVRDPAYIAFVEID